MTKTLGQVGYEAYGDTCQPLPWKTWDGKPMPTWDELSEEVRRRWEVAAAAIVTTRSPSPWPG